MLLVMSGCDDCQLTLQAQDGATTAETSGSTTRGASTGSSGPDGGEATTGAAEASTSGSTGTTGALGAITLCGNDVVDAGEACDDGNMSDLDDCPSGEFGRCKAEAHCGDGLVWTGEEACDDGNLKDDDGCPSGAGGRCEARASCGDGLVWAGMETCDDGNLEDDDGCPSGADGRCRSTAYCGDGLVWTGMEACDDGNADDLDACPSGAGGCAAPATCGDGFVWAAGGEVCDDGNGVPYDRCGDCLPGRYVFVSSKKYPGDLDGVSGADARCQALADQAGLGGTFRAWIADQQGSEPATWIDWWFSGRYVATCHELVANGWDLHLLESPIRCDEWGGFAEGGEPAWSNVDVGGDIDGPYDCDGWSRFDLGGLGAVGTVGSPSKSWTSADVVPCNYLAHLYCFEVAD